MPTWNNDKPWLPALTVASSEASRLEIPGMTVEWLEQEQARLAQQDEADAAAEDEPAEPTP